MTKTRTAARIAHIAPAAEKRPRAKTLSRQQQEFARGLQSSQRTTEERARDMLARASRVSAATRTADARALAEATRKAEAEAERLRKLEKYRAWRVGYKARKAAEKAAAEKAAASAAPAAKPVSAEPVTISKEQFIATLEVYLAAQASGDQSRADILQTVIALAKLLG